MTKSPSIIDDPNYEHFLAFDRLADAKAPTCDGIAAHAIKQTVETHIDALNPRQLRGLVAFVESHARRVERSIVNQKRRQRDAVSAN